MTILIIIITALVSILAWRNDELFQKLKFNPYYIKRDMQWYRFFSYALLHADWAHLLINMFVLWSFSKTVIYFFGMDFGNMAGLYFMLLYLGGVFFSSVFDFFKQQNNIHYSAVGASGAVAAVVFASIILYPNGKISFFLIPIGIPSWIFGILYLIYSAYMGKRGGDNIGHNAHFWGAVFGVIFMMIINIEYISGFYQQLGVSF